MRTRGERKSRIRARSRMHARASRARVDVYTYTRRNVRVQKGDAEKCACGANGGECNATRAEPAAECSPRAKLRGSLVSRLLCAETRTKGRGGGRGGGEGREGRQGTGLVVSPPGPFIIADAKRDVEARRIGDTIHRPAGRCGMQKTPFIFQYLGIVQVVGTQNAFRYLKNVSGV